MFGQGGCAQSRRRPLNPSPHNHTSSNNFDRDHCMTTTHHSPNSSVAWSARVQTPIKEWRFGKWELVIINKEIGHWSLQLPPLSTSCQCTFNLGNETQHKGATKGDGGLAICDSYGDGELMEGGNGHWRSHKWQWDSNPLARALRRRLHVHEDGNIEKLCRASKWVEGGTHGALWL
jgi:hypothetical protein